MKTLLSSGLLLVLALLASATAQADPAQRPERFGLLEIGDTPRQINAFVKTDCGTGRWAFGDCSATDKAGREYAFFDGIVVIVSLNARNARRPIRLPGRLVFGEDIRVSAAKLAKALGVVVGGGRNPSGEISYETDMVLPSRSGLPFQIVLVADKRGKLAEFIERINSV